MRNKIGIAVIILVLLGVACWFFVHYFLRAMPTQPASSSPTSTSVIPPASNSHGFKTYTNKEFGFEFQYPADWEFHAGTFFSPFSKFNLVGASPEENGHPDPIAPSIVINIVTYDFADRAVTNFENLNASTSFVFVGGVVATEYQYIFENQSRIAIVGLSLGHDRVLLGGGGKYIDTINQILSTFKFLK